jgi:cAMP-dependent protein kinase regulator
MIDFSHNGKYLPLAQDPLTHRMASPRTPPRLSPDDYLASKNVRKIIANIVTSLLEARPDNVEAHIASMFSEFAPKQPETFPPLAVHHPPLTVIHDPPHDSFPSMGGDHPPPARRMSAISSDVLRRVQAGGRRAEIKPRRVPTNLEIKPVPKDPETTAALDAACRNVGLFSFLQDDQRQTLVSAMFKREFRDGEVIMRQGDPPDNFYILLSGACKILKTTNGVEKHIASLGPGSYFGELAMISGSTRSATVMAEGELTVTWAIDQVTYLYLLKEHHLQKRQLYRTLLRRVPWLHGLEDYEILLIADALSPVNPAHGDVLMQQGDIGEDFFIILEGKCKVLRARGDEPMKEVATLEPESYFGEMALLTDHPRAATVVAGDGCKLVRLDKRNFLRLLGPHSAVFRQHFLMYHVED